MHADNIIEADKELFNNNNLELLFQRLPTENTKKIDARNVSGANIVL
jgi:hypothetical protein